MKLFKSHLFIRNLYAQTLMENFLIAGVSTILGIRFYLQLTGYPSIGGSLFHISHMLFGGFIMMFTLFLLFTFLNRTALTIGSVSGGVGFGFFIDELGKFITRDNNYFFEPTVALIYVIFILIYLISELLPKYKSITKQEYLVNALELTKEVVIQDLDTTEKKQALAYLKKSDQSNSIAIDLHDTLTAYRSKPDTTYFYTKAKQQVTDLLDLIVKNMYFYFFVIFFIVIQSVLSLLFTFVFIASLNRILYLLAALIISLLSFYFLKNMKLLYRILLASVIGLVLWLLYYLTANDVRMQLSFIGWGTLLSTSLAAAIAYLGLLVFNKSSLAALRYFRISVLVSLFLTQFFLFYQFQLLALIGLAANVLMLLTLEYVITKKESLPETIALVAR